MPSWTAAVFPFFAIAFCLSAQTVEQWRNLRQITYSTTYSVVLGDCRCLSGRIERVAADGLVLGVKGSATHVPASEILRVTEDCRATAHDFVMNTDSSWNYVKAAKPWGPEYLRVTTLDGREHRFKKPTVLEDSLSQDGKTIRKADVRSAYYVRVKPLSDGNKYVVKEDVPLLAPPTWFNYAFSGRIAVFLFDSTLPSRELPKCVIQSHR